MLTVNESLTTCLCPGVFGNAHDRLGVLVYDVPAGLSLPIITVGPLNGDFAT
jgi:hypothetical protein